MPAGALLIHFVRKPLHSQLYAVVNPSTENLRLNINLSWGDFAGYIFRNLVNLNLCPIRGETRSLVLNWGLDPKRSLFPGRSLLQIIVPKITYLCAGRFPSRVFAEHHLGVSWSIVALSKHLLLLFCTGPSLTGRFVPVKERMEKSDKEEKAKDKTKEKHKEARSESKVKKSKDPEKAKQKEPGKKKTEKPGKVLPKIAESTKGAATKKTDAKKMSPPKKAEEAKTLTKKTEVLMKKTEDERRKRKKFKPTPPGELDEDDEEVLFNFKTSTTAAQSAPSGKATATGSKVSLQCLSLNLGSSAQSGVGFFGLLWRRCGFGGCRRHRG